MRRITGEQYERVKSSQETLNKWYDFLKKGAKNSGFGPNVYEHLKPFESDTCVVPSVEEEVKLEDSGRIFYEMSLADKIRSLIVLNMQGLQSRNMGQLIVQVVANSLYYLLATSTSLPDIEGINMADLKDNYYMSDQENSIFKKALYQILKSVEISYVDFSKNPYTEHVATYSTAKLVQIENPWTSSIDTENITNRLAEETQTLGENISLTIDNLSKAIPLIKVKYFDDIYINKDLGIIIGKYDGEIHCKMSPVAALFRNVSTTLSFYPQALNDPYMVLSLNPIDKIMASTKQPYGSCLSLAKEGENNGATGMNIDNGTGLFAMMPSDKVYMIYYCNGKHKNMYWEKEEWDKSPENRNKDKAYKFFKYSLRQFGYVCKSIDEAEEERILPGRTYLAQTSEQRVFELLNAILLDEVGVKTSWSRFRKEVIIPTANLVEGEVNDPDYCWYDNYAYRRGIYFDNVVFLNYKAAAQPDSIVYSYAKITTGYNRKGSYRMTEFSRYSAPNVNAFTLLSGEASYGQYNTNIKICAHCGKLIGEYENSVLFGSDRYCLDCATELHIKECEICGEVYKEEDAEEHRIIDLSRYLPYPERLEVKGKKKICLHRLKQAQYTDFSSKAINRNCLCPFCGSIESDPWEAATASIEEEYIKQFSFIEIEGLKIKIRACYSCKRDCVICDCCKKLILLDDNTFPVVLMGNRRIICPDCIEKIRLKKQKKEALKEALQGLTEDKEEYISEDDAPQNASADTAMLGLPNFGKDSQVLKIHSNGSCNKYKHLKDQQLQLASMVGKKGKGYPAIAGIN